MLTLISLCPHHTTIHELQRVERELPGVRLNLCVCGAVDCDDLIQEDARCRCDDSDKNLLVRCELDANKKYCVFELDTDKCSVCNQYTCQACRPEGYDGNCDDEHSAGWCGNFVCDSCLPNQKQCSYDSCDRGLTCSECIQACDVCAATFCFDTNSLYECPAALLQCTACDVKFCSDCLPQGYFGDRFFCTFCEDFMCRDCLDKEKMTMCASDVCEIMYWCSTEKKNCSPLPLVVWSCKVCEEDIDPFCSFYCAGDDCVECIRCKKLTCCGCADSQNHHSRDDGNIGRCSKMGHDSDGFLWQLCKECTDERDEDDTGCPTCSGFVSSFLKSIRVYTQ